MASPSFDDLYNAGKAEMLLRKPSLAINEGDISDVILNAGAAMADKAVQESIANLRKTFLSTADGEDLATLVRDHFNIEPGQATYAVGSIAFLRSVGPLSAGTIPAGTIVSTDFDADGNRVEYATDQDVAWLATETGIKSVTVTASTTGTRGNVAATTVTNIVSNIFDTNITCTNANPMAGGNDQESSDSLRERARTFSATLRRGTLAALEYGALQVDGVRIVTATEDINTGIVSVYVADETGASNLQMIADVELELENWRCAGIIPDVVGGAVYLQNIDIEIVTSRGGFNVEERSQDIIDAVEGALTKLKIGDTLFIDYIIAAVRSVDPDNIIEVSVTNPGSNIVPPNAYNMIRAGTVTVV